MPPFGNLYGMDVFADESLAEDKEIAFNAGTHRELVRMRFEDFERLAKPFVLPIAARRGRARGLTARAAGGSAAFASPRWRRIAQMFVPEEISVIFHTIVHKSL